MKWNKAIEQIEKALADGKRVEVSFHRKWARNCNEFKTDRVDCVSAYDWHGETCKGVSTFEGYGLDEGNFIIDDVIVEMTRFEMAKEQGLKVEEKATGVQAAVIEIDGELYLDDGCDFVSPVTSYNEDDFWIVNE